MLRSRRKPAPESAPVVLGYIDTARIPAGQTVIEVGAPMRARAAECGYSWGGTYLDHHTHGETVAALTRAAVANPAVVAVVVPDHTHLPHGLHTITANTRHIRVLTTDTIEDTLDGRAHPAEVGRDG
ncbi:hypothetical protein [Nocardia australiensis]|uniref:hypothetical protein n=1 Tax=Nocardia australiensis TaxID=2887191 RepID=UPI001D139AFE|nr:hypothetical protein [Nocardia australiensis]